MKNYELNKTYIIRLVCHSLKQKSQPENKNKLDILVNKKKFKPKTEKND